MIGTFENMVRRYPHRTCFTYVNEAGEEEAYSYRETRMLAAAIARHLRDKGVRQGDSVSVDLPNCPAYVLLILAAAYGGFSLVTLNHRLTSGEKMQRMLELERRSTVRIALRVDEARAESLIKRALALLAGEEAPEARRSGRTMFASREVAAESAPRSARGLGRAPTGRAGRRRRDEVARQDVVEEIIHFAERSAHVFDSSVRALIMFTSGTTGRAKAVELTWDNLCRSAEASNVSLNRMGEGAWQAALPLYHIGGFQVVVRSVLNCCPFFLYQRFDAQRLLVDAEHGSITHVSVVDKMLQDILAADTTGTLRRYVCVLLGGGPLNPTTIERALEEHVRVYASYGMTETSSQIAHAQVTRSFTGGLRLLPGYDVHIIDPGEDGFGRLAVKGPGVCRSYLNARPAFTVDGYFLTGDTAALYNGYLFVKERTADMFVSGGENVYPAEIREMLLRVPGVSDAYVWGTSDATWGRRPVALIERAPQTPTKATPAASAAAAAMAQPRSGALAQPVEAHQFAAAVQAALEPRLSKLYLPQRVLVVDELPRTGIGKIDRAAIEQSYDQRIQVERVTLYRIRMPFTHPFKTAKGTLTHRESVLVEVTDHAGRVGLGECVSFPTDWYLPETLDQDIRVLRDVLAPLVTHEVFLHPREVAPLFFAHPEAASFPMACGALEPALWDLYGKITGQPLWKLIGGAAPASHAGAGVGAKAQASAQASVAVPAGAVVGMGTVNDTVSAVRRCVEAGYRRVKLKISPDGALQRVRAVRSAFPDLMLTLDANQSFTERDLDELRAFDSCNVAWIEEPLDPKRLPTTGSTDLFDRLARLQRSVSTPFCLDESIEHPRDVSHALTHPELRCYSIKIGKFGGVQPALEFVQLARSRGIAVWMGGMYDTGISKRLHAAFETLPGVEVPGDIGATGRYFSGDVTDPPHTVERGFVTLNRAGHEHGLGCTLNRSVLASVLVDRMVITG